MFKKNYFLFFHFMLLFFSHLSANQDGEHEEAFYAISSLKFHIEEEIANLPFSHEGEGITLDDSDIECLWKQAFDSPHEKKLRKAYAYYWESRDASSSEKLLFKVKSILDQTWNLLNPLSQPLIAKSLERHRYLLPDDHWLKSPLDEIFSEYDALKDDKTFKESGFEVICKRTSQMIVAKHEKIKGYLIKCYLRCDKPNKSWSWMCDRCEGAENIRRLIAKKKLKLFNVPDKWIYQLPAEVNDKGLNRELRDHYEPAVLVVTHMNIGSYQKSRKAWKEKITHEHLKELYCILSHGFASCYLILNIPYTKEGMFTCLDTEFPYRHHDYNKIYKYLSQEMKPYWEKLVKTGGRP